ncbi:hypothetical protein P7C70_g6704, partial [Phenoliferia sp. Uapishka_3]
MSTPPPKPPDYFKLDAEGDGRTYVSKQNRPRDSVQQEHDSPSLSRRGSSITPYLSSADGEEEESEQSNLLPLALAPTASNPRKSLGHPLPPDSSTHSNDPFLNPSSISPIAYSTVTNPRSHSPSPQASSSADALDTTASATLNRQDVPTIAPHPPSDSLSLQEEADRVIRVSNCYEEVKKAQRQKNITGMNKATEEFFSLAEDIHLVSQGSAEEKKILEEELEANLNPLKRLERIKPWVPWITAVLTVVIAYVLRVKIDKDLVLSLAGIGEVVKVFQGGGGVIIGKVCGYGVRKMRGESGKGKRKRLYSMTEVDALTLNDKRAILRATAASYFFDPIALEAWTKLLAGLLFLRNFLPQRVLGIFVKKKAAWSSPHSSPVRRGSISWTSWCSADSAFSTDWLSYHPYALSHSLPGRKLTKVYTFTTNFYASVAEIKQETAQLAAALKASNQEVFNLRATIERQERRLDFYEVQSDANEREVRRLRREVEYCTLITPLGDKGSYRKQSFAWDVDAEATSRLTTPETTSPLPLDPIPTILRSTHGQFIFDDLD